jgi:RimJ/RimL family protein N-acetyltransferase
MTAAIERFRPGIAAQFAADLTGQIPTLRAGTATLRAPRLSDFDTYADILCSERGQFMGGPMSREGAWADFANYTALWLLHGHGLWSIDTGEDTPAGFVLLGLEWEDPEPELGIFMSASGEGRGLARAACIAARDHAFATLHWTDIVSYVDPANTRCIALMTGLGASRDTALEHHFDEPTLIFRHHSKTEAV